MLKIDERVYINKIKDYLDKEVIVYGWIHKIRDLGGLRFIQLRDRTAIVQLMYNKNNEKLSKRIKDLKNEDIIKVKGKVLKRPQDSIKSDDKLGDIEIEILDFQVLAKSKELPFKIDSKINTSESLRLKYRYLDLRRPVMAENLYKRFKVISLFRKYLNSKNFIEVETPVLVRSTPEGARDFLVPSRLKKGYFYALPQSPQILKQLLMISGIDRYYQIAKCFRDEDLRANRQPEFSQLDIELSFVERDDILEFFQDLIKYVFSNLGYSFDYPFPVISYKDAIEKYGTDKPDIRFKMEIVDITKTLKKLPFGLFKQLSYFKAINVKGLGKLSRKQIDILSKDLKDKGVKAVFFIFMLDGNFKTSILKYLTEEVSNELIKKLNIENGDSIIILGGNEADILLEQLGELRLKYAKELKLIDENLFKFLWVVDFPLFSFNKEENRIESEHHPFTSPKKEYIDLLEKEPLSVISNSYDLVLNGIELASGSIRISDPDLQYKVFEIIGISKQQADEQFGFLLEALKYSAPPHGGIALGIDRLIQEIVKAESIRDVIAFPKTQTGSCLLTGAPVKVDKKQLEILGINLKDSKLDE